MIPPSLARNPIDRDRRAGSVRLPDRRLVLSAVSLAAAIAAMLVTAGHADDQMLDYGVGIVPLVVPLLAASLTAAAAVMASQERLALSGAMIPVVGVVGVLTAWSVVMLPFDALRIVRLVPLPLSAWGLVMRLLLLLAAATTLVQVLAPRRARQDRCGTCRRHLPGRLDRVSRWPIVVAVVFALPYPVLRIVWALGGTFGTTGDPLELDPVVAWGAAVAGMTLVAFTAVLLFGKGPLWARALLGLGGLVLGVALTITGGLAATRSLMLLATEGLQSSQGDHLMTWTFVIVYGSWCVAGLGIIAGSWRYWAHRRDACPSCRLAD